MVKVKVCGITALVDAEKALQFGADMLGFNFYAPSPRYVTPAAAREIIACLPSHAWNIALFVNETKEKVRAIIANSCSDDGRQSYSGLQFHGEESANYCRGWELKVIKAFRLKEPPALEAIGAFPADYYLLDSWSAGYGGSGSQFPWEWIRGLDSSRLIISGGLDVGNVVEAIRQIHPYGVDVCSGVEARPGVKDHGKLKEFIAAAKGA